MSTPVQEGAENPHISYQDSEYIRQIAFAVADAVGLHRGTPVYKRSVDLARTLLTECHRRCRQLDLAAMRHADTETVRQDLTTLRERFNMNDFTLPEGVTLNFETNPQQVAA